MNNLYRVRKNGLEKGHNKTGPPVTKNNEEPSLIPINHILNV